MVILAIDKLHDFDSALLRLNSYEWSLSHRLAVYLEQLVRGWDVDCEYNRQGQYKDIKKRSNGCRIRPDINIHHRGHVESVHNLLVIEVKINETESDSEKVCEYTRPPNADRRFQYQFGLALSLKPTPKLKWFTNGSMIN